MKKLLALLALLACLGAARAEAADTTYVGTTVYTTGDCSSCVVDDSEYYLMTGTMSGSLPTIPMAVVDSHTGLLVPALVVPAGPGAEQYGYLGPIMGSTASTSDKLWMYSVYQQPTQLDVGGFSVNVMPNNRFRLINHHYIPSRESAEAPADSVRLLNPFETDRVQPTSFGAGVKEQ